MKQIWKDIEGFEGSYQVSNRGNIRSYRRYLTFMRSGKLFTRLMRGMDLKQSITYAGYCRIQLMQKGYSVHRLVAKAFIPNPYNKPQVNHIDFNRKNNTINNLEWVTIMENNHHTRDAGRFNGMNARLTHEQVVEIRSRYIKGEVGSYMLGREYGISPISILDIVKRKNYKYIK